jgi:GNAT superfamily N-acetyltransferase
MDYIGHYARYLGCHVDAEPGISIIRSPLRDKAENRRTPLILSFFAPDRIVLSVSWDLEAPARELAGTLETAGADRMELVRCLDDFLFDRFRTYRVEQFQRMTVDEGTLLDAGSRLELVRPLSQGDKGLVFNHEGLRNRGQRVREHNWEYDSKLINEGRLFAIVEGGKLLSQSSITEVECGGGNIAVSTDDAHRRKGYGKAVVHRATTWCFRNGIVPIYWVNADNAASISLARSIGYKAMHDEIVVTHWPGDAVDRFKQSGRPSEGG